ncbi:unnamed protein product [Absidia cylindrospora]
MTLFVAGHPCSPTSPTRTLKSEENDGMDSLDYLDPLFPDIASLHLIDNSSMHPYLDHHDISSPSSSSSLHNSSSATTTPSPASQYDVLHSEKHIIPADLLSDNNNTLMQSTLSLPDSYHRLTAEYYARSNNIFDSNNNNIADIPLNDAPASNEGLQIRVLGIPSLGAKSRVETQIKLGLQLLTSNGSKVPHWSYLRLPEHMLARSKLRKTQQQKLLDGSVATMVSDESKVLTLDAQVICSTNTSKSVRMCPGCVRRERKRAERTKDGKPRYESDLTCLNGSSTPEQDSKRRAENMLEKDRDRILLFNCSPMVNFSSGDTILPTRITCYCRHHNEKVGFRIQFVMRNDQGSIVAKGCSPPIMITDDHKSSKQRNNSVSGTSSANDTNNNDGSSRKRGRSDYENQQAPDTPAPSRRGSISEHNNNNTMATTPLHLNPSASFVIPSSTSSPYQYSHPSPPTDGITTPNNSLSSSPQTMLIGNDLAMTPFTADNASPYSQTLQHAMPTDTMTNLLNGTLTNDTTTTANNNNNNNNPYILPTANNGLSNDGTWPQNRRRRITNNSGYTTDETIPTWRSDYTPQLERLVPAQGPTYGGVEVTVLGSGFYRGLTCLFGEHAASTVYWNPNTLVCVLPPAATPGPVVVSFKEHPIVLEGQDVALFTYYDASDQALLELALQVVGLKMTGKLHDAKHIAMLIVRGDQQRSQQQQQQQQSQQHQSQQQQTHAVDDLGNTTDDDDEDDDNQSILTSDDDDDDNDSLNDWSWREGTDLEKHIINALEASDAHDVMHTNPSGHTMLHLAVLLRYGALTKMLLNKMDLPVIDQADRNGCTALHFACIQNNAPMVQLLLNAGAQPTETCSVGSPLELATDAGVRSLLAQSTPSSLPSPSTTPSASPIPPPSLPRRLSFKSHVRRFYMLKQRGNDAAVAANDQTASNDLDHNGLGFAQYKHDRRLYLFWLPLLIVTIGLLYYQILGDRTLMNLLQDMIPFQRHELNTIVGY